jgi:DNA-binding NarL/FixJ family response regulator
MSGGRQPGRPWTRFEEKQLLDMLGAGLKPSEITEKLKRTIGAVRVRSQYLYEKRKNARERKIS